jgi:phosphoribosylamine--glycine ligase
MKVMVIGSGGREHALAWKLAQSPRVSEVLVAPGNAGTAREPKVRNVPLAVSELDHLVAFAQKEDVALTVVGPELPLVEGVVDRFRERGLRIFGPRRNAARLEGSKTFTKEFLARHGIPTARFGSFTELAPALAYVRREGAPIVIKADGLAAGKGVVVAMTLGDAEQALHDILGGKALGEAGRRVVVEEFLAGEEASYIVMCDGRNVLPLATSQDHKRRDENDLGPNTGGMGAYSPAPVVTPEVEARVLREIIQPTVRGMAAEGAPFMGFLYAGLMIGKDGTAKVLEYNVRFGDPETQPIMLRLRSDLVDLIEAALDGRLDAIEARWDPRPAVGVVMAAAGYPGTVRNGDAIEGLDAALPPDTRLFHAGTRLQDERVVSAGGRILSACALGDDVAQARVRAYAALSGVRCAGSFWRRDIGWRALATR